MKKIIIALLVGVLAVQPALASPPDEHGKRGERAAKLAEELKLSDTQKKDFKEFRDKMKELRESHKELFEKRKEFFEKMSNYSVSESELRAKSGELISAEGKLMSERLEQALKLRKSLSEEQYTKLMKHMREKMERMKERFKDGKKGGGRFGPPAPREDDEE